MSVETTAPSAEIAPNTHPDTPVHKGGDDSRTSKRFTAQEKAEIIGEVFQVDEGRLASVAVEHGVSEDKLKQWLDSFKTAGARGLRTGAIKADDRIAELLGHIVELAEESAREKILSALKK